MSDKKEEIINKTMNLSVMDKEANEALELLTSKLTVKEMDTLKPIVAATNDLQKVMEIKYVEGDADSIQAYKDGKRTYGSFNSSLAEAKRDLKAPYTEMTKAIDTIFKKFSELYKMTKDQLAEEFKPYTDEQQRLKEERLAKKNAAREAEMKKLQDDNAEMVQKNENIRIFNAIHYEVILGLKNSAIENLNSLNSSAIEKKIESVQNMALATAIYESDVKVVPSEFNVLSDNQKSELTETFTKTKSSIVESYRSRLNEVVQLEQAKLRQQQKQEEVVPPVVPTVEQKETVPAPPDEFDINSFIAVKTSELEGIKNECDFFYEVNKEHQDAPLAKNIAVMLSKALEYVYKVQSQKQ
tara:strand:+ start:21332 stop:22396 length:1065 start_codon:yes stop_codon:yes gene_type:complete